MMPDTGTGLNTVRIAHFLILHVVCAGGRKNLGDSNRHINESTTLEGTFRCHTGHLMQLNLSFKHSTLDIEGVQFHPESILTEHGHALLQNFLVPRAGGLNHV